MPVEHVPCLPDLPGLGAARSGARARRGRSAQVGADGAAGDGRGRRRFAAPRRRARRGRAAAPPVDRGTADPAQSAARLGRPSALGPRWRRSGPGRLDATTRGWRSDGCPGLRGWARGREPGVGGQCRRSTDRSPSRLPPDRRHTSAWTRRGPVAATATAPAPDTEQRREEEECDRRDDERTRQDGEPRRCRQPGARPDRGIRLVPT